MIKRILYSSVAALLILCMLMATGRGMAVGAYQAKITAMQAAYNIGYWPFNELSGTTINDQSGYARNGSYVGAAINNSIGPDLDRVPRFDGVNDAANLFGASLAGAFNGEEGTVLLWIKPYDANIWTDGASRYIAYIYADANNSFFILKGAGANNITFRYTAGGTARSAGYTLSETGWICLSGTWSRASDVVSYYVNGASAGSYSGLGVWAGTPTIITAGANSTTGANSWNGWLAHVAMWSIALSASEVAAACDTNIPPTPTPTATYTPTPDIYSYLGLSSGQGARVAFEVNVGEIMIAIIALIILGVLIWKSWHSMTTSRS